VRMRSRSTVGVAAGLCAVLAAFGSSSTAIAKQQTAAAAPAGHVLLLSVDGLHQSDLTWWIHAHPYGNIARLVRGGVEYDNASTPIPSDSFPGLVAQITGGNPATTGIYYDDTYNRSLLPPGATCTPGQTTGLGGEVNLAENLDVDSSSIDAGFGIANLYAGLPWSVKQLPGDTATIDQKMIDPANLPIDPATCKPVYPHQYLEVNTVFEVAHAAGLHTAWTDKHASYEITSGPSGTGVDDLFAPEINSSATDPKLPAGAGADWTANNHDTQFYDEIKVDSVINEINGFDHSGTTTVGVPAIFGMNFQSVSTAEKLPTSPLSGLTQNGGYVRHHGAWVPGPVLQDALGFVDAQVGRMLYQLNRQGLLASTTLILSAKHGQSPIETSSLKRIDDGKIIDAANAAWTMHGGAGKLIAFAIDDDAMYVWLGDRSPAAVSFARSFLLGYNQPASAHAATDYAGDPVGFHSSGLAHVYGGPAYFGVPASDARVPDLVGVVQHGVVYTGKTGKIAEHGGADREDTHVPLVVFGAGASAGEVGNPVETTEIAPTILTLLGLDPQQLQAVQAEHTTALPGF
jgi:Type I phosphodiesterase / nucleotide pyrophosphatase